MNPMQITMAAINAMKGGGEGCINKKHYNNNKGGIKGEKGEKDSGKGCCNCGGNHLAEIARTRRRKRGNAKIAAKLATWPRTAESPSEESTITRSNKQFRGHA